MVNMGVGKALQDKNRMEQAAEQLALITGQKAQVTKARRAVSGFRLRDGRASYGIGLETFALGFPIHFDWAWRTLFNKGWEDLLFAADGGSSAFRKPRFGVWIGYDF